MLQKYHGSKPLLIGVPYPVVFEIPAAQTNGQIGPNGQMVKLDRNPNGRKGFGESFRHQKHEYDYEYDYDYEEGENGKHKFFFQNIWYNVQIVQLILVEKIKGGIP